MLLTISFIGNMNVGKSTLFNLLTKSNDALVIDIPGTTRDRIYEKVYYKKQKYIVCDTPGISLKK